MRASADRASEPPLTAAELRYGPESAQRLAWLWAAQTRWGMGWRVAVVLLGVCGAGVPLYLLVYFFGQREQVLNFLPLGVIVALALPVLGGVVSAVFGQRLATLHPAGQAFVFAGVNWGSALAIAVVLGMLQGLLGEGTSGDVGLQVMYFFALHVAGTGMPTFIACLFAYPLAMLSSRPRPALMIVIASVVLFAAFLGFALPRVL